MTQRITKERADLLAMHAIVVQGGFSTPEIEKERAEKDLAQGGEIDFDKIRAEVIQATIDKARPQEEIDSAALEGIAPMPEDLIPLRNEKVALDEQISELQKRLREIKDTFAERLYDDGLIGYTLGSKVKARESHGTRHTLDSKKLKEEMPHVHAKYLKATEYVSINIS